MSGRLSASLLALCVVLSVPAFAAAPSVSLEDLTWTELAASIKGWATTIIVPIGGTEQNGPHMTLGKHNARARVLAERIARELGNALVAPVIAYVPEGALSPPTAHMRFPGTITVPETTFEQVIEAAARSFRLAGFRDVVLLGDHGGYQKNDRAVAQRLNREWAGSAVRVHAIDEYYRAAEVEFAQALKARGYRDDEIGTHAGLADTSLALAVDRQLVRVERLQGGAVAANADGVQGDPRRASVELGKIGVDLIVARTVAAIRAATAKR